MNKQYDMCVDCDTLIEIEDRLKRISHNLRYNTDQMIDALRHSEVFLGGQQYEKAKKTTGICLEITKSTDSNLNNAIDYIEDLIEILDEYSKLGYSG